MVSKAIKNPPGIFVAGVDSAAKSARVTAIAYRQQEEAHRWSESDPPSKRAFSFSNSPLPGLSYPLAEVLPCFVVALWF